MKYFEKKKWPISIGNIRNIRIFLARSYHKIEAKMDKNAEGSGGLWDKTCWISYTGRTSARFNRFTTRCRCWAWIFITYYWISRNFITQIFENGEWFRATKLDMTQLITRRNDVFRELFGLDYIRLKILGVITEYKSTDTVI